MPVFVTAYIFYSVYFFNYQLVISLEQRLRLNNLIEYIRFTYHPLRPGFLCDDLYRAHFFPAFMVHQKAKPGCKPFFGTGIGHYRFVDSQDIGN